MGIKKIPVHDRDRPLLTLGLSLLRRELEARLRAQDEERDRAETAATLERLERLYKQIEG